MIQTINSLDLVASFDEKSSELISLVKENIEFMHAGELETEKHPDSWNHSDIVLFPVGKAKDNLFANCAIGQHGLPRHLKWNCTNKTNNSITFSTEYVSPNKIKNTKTPLGNEPAELSWPWSFKIEKKFEIKESLKVTFTITNTDDKPQDYTFGWHPAFKLPKGLFVVRTDASLVSPDDIKRAGTYGEESRMASLLTRERSITVESNCGAFQLWRPGAAPMICIEPVTALCEMNGYTNLSPPYGKTIRPKEAVSYEVIIAPEIIREE